MNFIKENTHWFPTESGSINIKEKLGPSVYTIESIPFRGTAFKSIGKFEIPKKLYGKTTEHTKRIIETYKARKALKKSTGVSLIGEKGSGKTLLAKNISNELLAEDVPTLLVNSAPDNDEGLNKIITAITQPVVVIFDEFEKHFEKKDQENILTLLSGTLETQALFLFTVNDVWGINEYMKNRPDRIYYCIEFGGVTEPAIREYCEINLKNKDYIERVVLTSNLFEKFNFDMLQGMVEEMNRYGQDPMEVLELLNLKVESYGTETFIPTLYYQDKQIHPPLPEVKDISKKSKKIKPIFTGVECLQNFNTSPLRMKDDVVCYVYHDETKKYNGLDSEHLRFNLGHLDKKETNISQGHFVFKKGDFKIVYERKNSGFRTMDWFQKDY